MLNLFKLGTAAPRDHSSQSGIGVEEQPVSHIRHSEPVGHGAVYVSYPIDAANYL